MSKKKHLIVLGGATATGKTALAVELAQHFQTEILSADSRQFYREMNIGTAKPEPALLQAIPHHFIDFLKVTQLYSVGDFERDALILLEKLFQKHDCVVLTGGSGLFLKAVCEGLDEYPAVPPEVLVDVVELFENQGLEPLKQELLEKDPAYYARLDLDNPHRLIRAVSVIRASGQPFSSFQKKEKAPRNFEPVYLLLDVERSVLYERINQRVDEMITNGLEAEALKLYPHRHLNALQTVGYQEFFEFFDGKISKEEAIEKIKQNTRRYAKRQGTWFRREAHWAVFSPGETERLIGFMESLR